MLNAGGCVAADPRYWGLLLLIVTKQFERVNNRRGNRARRDTTIHRLPANESICLILRHVPRRHENGLCAFDGPHRSEIFVEPLDLAAQPLFVAELAAR
jgi:hypothetical protein